MVLLSLDTLYVLLGMVVVGVVVASSAVLYQYFTFNSCPPGTRPLPSPKGRLPLIGHRNLIAKVTSRGISNLWTDVSERASRLPHQLDSRIWGNIPIANGQLQICCGFIGRSRQGYRCTAYY